MTYFLPDASATAPALSRTVTTSVLPSFIPELQSLRGAAAVVVMIGHALQYYNNPAWFHTASLVFNGRAAVVIFFVLSGYVLTRSLIRTDLDRSVIWRFYVRRIFRIYPAIWVASGLGLLYLSFLHWSIKIPNTGTGIQHQFRPDRMDFFHIAASLAGMLAYILPQLWSIFVEIVASMFIPLVVYVAIRGRVPFLVMIIASLVLSFTVGPRTYYNIGLYLPDFLFGASLCVFATQITYGVHMFGKYVGRAMSATALCLVGTQYLPTSYYDPTVHLLESILATTLIAIIVYSGRPIPIFRRPLVTFVGDISYSVYLTHYVVLCTIAKLLFLFLPDSYSEYPVLLSLFLVALMIPATVLLSGICYSVVEKPGIRAGNWVNSIVMKHLNVSAKISTESGT